MPATCTRPSCVRGSHVCIKALCCCKFSKSFGVVMFCPLRVLRRRCWERGMALGMMSLHSNHLTLAWCCTTLCAMSCNALSLFSEPRIEQCCSQECLLCLWHQWVVFVFLFKCFHFVIVFLFFHQAQLTTLSITRFFGPLTIHTLPHTKKVMSQNETLIQTNKNEQKNQEGFG